MKIFQGLMVIVHMVAGAGDLVQIMTCVPVEANCAAIAQSGEASAEPATNFSSDVGAI